jgi:hypothetical protein
MINNNDNENLIDESADKFSELILDLSENQDDNLMVLLDRINSNDVDTIIQKGLCKAIEKEASILNLKSFFDCCVKHTESINLEDILPFTLVNSVQKEIPEQIIVGLLKAMSKSFTPEQNAFIIKNSNEIFSRRNMGDQQRKLTNIVEKSKKPITVFEIVKDGVKTLSNTEFPCQIM